jgi:hypothetical protein
MSTKTYYELIKAIIFVLVVAFIGFAGLQAYGWINMKMSNQETVLKAELEAQRQRLDLQLNEVRVKTNVVNKKSDNWETIIAELRKENVAMTELIKQNQETIKNVGTINTKMNENLSLELRKLSDHTYKVGTDDPNEQYFKKIYAKEKDAEGNVVEIPIAWAIYYPNKPLDKQWKTGVYPIEYKTKIIQTEQQDGQWNTYVEAWAENNKDKASLGKELPLKIEVADFTQVKKETTEFYWWSPHLNLNLDITFGSDFDANAGGGLSISTSGYGRTKNDLIWRFIDFGISTNGDEFWGKFSPFAYNIGEHIPLISNTFLGPFVGYEFNDGAFIGGLSVSVPF